jgi:SAM-dependent methyltransferase
MSRLGACLHKLYQKLPRPPSTNLPTGQLKVRLLDSLPTGSVILDVGAKDDRGKRSARPDLRYISLDLCGGPGIDVIADAHFIPLASQSVDAAQCINVLAHCGKPDVVIRELKRVLKPGGMLYINSAFVFRTAADPVDYYRFSCWGLHKLCAEYFEVVQSGFNRGPASSMADMLSHFFAIGFCFNSKSLHDVLVDVFQWLLFPLKYWDVFLNRSQFAHVIHNGAFVVCRSPRPQAADTVTK